MCPTLSAFLEAPLFVERSQHTSVHIPTARPFQTQHLLSGRRWLLQPGTILQFPPSHCQLVYLIRAISNAQGSCPGIELSQGVVAA